MLANQAKDMELSLLPSRRRRNRRNSLPKSELDVNVSTKLRDNQQLAKESLATVSESCIVQCLD
ncbi:hypothetical protein SNR37_001021 [Agarivorans aestuarii]|uniref:Uncharacterized protein n=1 Tax=Agarivorans aestuarii TaxID=1563703 RepID=A0ABU7G8V1_9ALTE|nr:MULTISPECIES: hypothetical protein [Agarivorans]MEE1675695.1 hypothetical protein [Agarivorans aestuarii]